MAAGNTSLKRPLYQGLKKDAHICVHSHIHSLRASHSILLSGLDMKTVTTAGLMPISLVQKGSSVSTMQGSPTNETKKKIMCKNL